MFMQSRESRATGNKIAPWRFILFLIVFAGSAIAGSMATMRWQEATMIAFDLAAIVFLGSLWPVMNDGSRDSIRRHASQNDANRGLLLALAAVIVAVLLVTIATELSAPGKPLASLIVATLMLAWLFANIIYTLHYAHLYHGTGKAKSGLTFPGKTEPEYWDFAYFAFTVGMTFQTSDVEITVQDMRRVALAQSIAAFVFNIGVLAFTINILGGG